MCTVNYSLKGGMKRADNVTRILIEEGKLLLEDSEGTRFQVPEVTRVEITHDGNVPDRPIVVSDFLQGLQQGQQQGTQGNQGRMQQPNQGQGQGTGTQQGQGQGQWQGQPAGQGQRQ
jgi:hypothetical protein